MQNKMTNKTEQLNADAKKSTSIDSSKESFRQKAGDAIEKVGHKISEAGMPKVGQKIHDLGDSIEKDHKNSSHPHKV